MNEVDSSPRLGQMVKILRGRDAGQYAVIIRIIDDRFVMLADGEKRKYNRPKKKNLQHIEPIDYISPEIQTSLLETGRVTNGKLRFVVDKFTSSVMTDFKKGDE